MVDVCDPESTTAVVAPGWTATPVLTPAIVDLLRRVAEDAGLLRLAAVSLDDPGFAPARAALDRQIDAGRHGEMEFMERTRALRKDPRGFMPSARSMLVGLAPYDGEPGPIARYAQSRDYHTVLHHRLEVVEAALVERLPGVETLVCVDTKPVLERSAAVLAGLGFLGKNGCLIAPGLGSYVLIAVLLTSARWERVTASFAVPPWDACGSCRRCLDACPTEAFVGPGELDPRRCISYLTVEHRGEILEAIAERMGERIAGCDACQEVCPYNASRSRGERVPSQAWIEPPRHGRRTVDLVEIAGFGNGRHRAFVRDTALRRIPRRSLRRNALIALSNRGDTVPEDVLANAESDPDPHIRSAAKRHRERMRETGE